VAAIAHLLDLVVAGELQDASGAEE